MSNLLDDFIYGFKRWHRQSQLRAIEREIERLRDDVEDCHLMINRLITEKNRLECAVSHGE